MWDLGWDPAPALDHLADLRDAGLPIVALLLNEGQTAQVWAAGARGILRRDSSASVLGASINAVAEGLVVLDPELAAEVPVSPDLGHAPPPAGDLTAREREVLGLVAEGLANKSIAQRLGISEHTVKFHMNAIMGKLGVQSRTEAVTRATRLGLIIL